MACVSCVCSSAAVVVEPFGLFIVQPGCVWPFILLCCSLTGPVAVEKLADDLIAHAALIEHGEKSKSKKSNLVT